LSRRELASTSAKPAAETRAKTASAAAGIGATFPSSHWMTAPRRFVSTIEISTAIADEKKIPTMTPASSSVCTASPPAPAAMT
jgi:hypothetical protein